MISIDDFKNIELKVGKIMSAERVEGSEKLVRLVVDLGEKDAANLPAGRQVLASIGKAYTPETLVGKQIVVVANLAPRTFTLRHGSGQVGMESNGMLLAAEGEHGPVLLMPDAEVPPGAKIR